MPAGGFRSETESATEGMLLIMLKEKTCDNSIRHMFSISPSPLQHKPGSCLAFKFQVGDRGIGRRDRVSGRGSERPYQTLTVQEGCAPAPGRGPLGKVDDMFQVSG